MQLPLYRTREQTEVKHFCLERYLQAAARILGSWSDLVYVDCCAGPWKANGENLEDTSFARAIEVLKGAKKDLASRGLHPSIRCLLIEKDDDAYAQLEDYAKKQVEFEVVPKHWDFSEHMDDIARFIKRSSKPFPFVLIDPKGWELAYIDVIAPLLNLCPGEVLINLMTSFITRFIGDKSKQFERAVGAENLGRLRLLTGTEQEEAIVQAYSDQVRRAGNFAYVCNLPVMKPDQDAFHYYLIYCTRNPKGVMEFKQTEREAVEFMHNTRAEAQEHREFQRTGQYALLDSGGLYRESRYTEYQTANLARANQRVHSLLQQRRDIEYGVVWAETMQFAGVYSGDLRTWLDSLERLGKLVVLNRKPNERTYKKHHVLRYRGAQSHPEDDIGVFRRNQLARSVPALLVTKIFVYHLISRP